MWSKDNNTRESSKVQYWFDKLSWIKNEKVSSIEVQAALAICGLFIGDFAYMLSGNGLFTGT